MFNNANKLKINLIYIKFIRQNFYNRYYKLNNLYFRNLFFNYFTQWCRGGMATQRSAKPCIPVRSRTAPPD